MIAQRKKTYCINKNSIVTLPVSNSDIKAEDIEIKYFTDCVYHSLVYSTIFSNMQLFHSA
jgi:hypothetical protein